MIDKLPNIFDINNPLENLAKSFVDNVFKTTVKPKIGSIVFCELVFDATGHSGVYIGNNQIVHLDGSGKIETVSPEEFLNRLNGFNSAISIYVSCHDETPVGSKEIANRAKEMVGKQLDYNLVVNNCHKFTAGCILGDFENSTIRLNDLKRVCQISMEADNWLVWDYKN